MSSPHDPIFEEQVYLAFKDIFSGQSAKIRRAKVVLPIISQHKKRSGVSSLLQTRNQEFVCQSLCRLLNEQIFESQVKASRRFANNPRTAVPPAPVSKPAVPVSKPTAPVILEPPASELSVHQAPNSKSEIGTEMTNEKSTEPEPEMPTTHETPAPDTASSESSGETLEHQEPETVTPEHHEARYPTETSQLIVHLPFNTHHLMLSRAQAILEYACFQFAKERMPDILQRRQWHCPKAGELNLWVAEFRKHISTFVSSIDNPGGDDISACLHLATRIRHIAVHRELVETPFLETLMSSALRLCEMLGNAQALTQMMSIWECAQVQIRGLESLRREIVVELEDCLDDIAARRAELDKLEQAGIAKAHLRLRLHHDIASGALEEVLLDRDMVLVAAGKLVEVEKGQDEVEDEEVWEDAVQLSEDDDDWPPEKTGDSSRVLHMLQQCAKKSALLAQALFSSQSRPVWVMYIFFALILALFTQVLSKVQFGLDIMMLALSTLRVLAERFGIDYLLLASLLVAMTIWVN